MPVAAAVSLRGGCHEIEGKRGGGRGVGRSHLHGRHQRAAGESGHDVLYTGGQPWGVFVHDTITPRPVLLALAALAGKTEGGFATIRSQVRG
jgi:hypothetical protein